MKKLQILNINSMNSDYNIKKTTNIKKYLVIMDKR